MAKKVLLIDDDVELGRIVDMVLRPIEATVYQAYSGEEGLKRAYDYHPDMIILDVMMPGIDGFETCIHLRRITNIPILMLTARTSENDMIRGFNLGVDDFVRKPFRKDELEVRVRALLRRSDTMESSDSSRIHSYTDPVLEVDLADETVKLRGEILDLSPREYELFSHLVREQGKIVSHRELVRDTWGEFQLNGTAITSLYICYLRKKIQDGQFGHEYIRTKWGRGYWFEARKKE
jgi:DNA-binding response OmpR family regulator